MAQTGPLVQTNDTMMCTPAYRSLLWGLLMASFLPAWAQRSATILDHRDRIRISRMDVLNSQYRETNLSITPDGRFLYFMSLRGGQPWSHKFMVYREDSVYDGDIWYSTKVGGRWQRPRCMPFGINSYEGEDEPNVSPDGRTVYFQSWNTFWQETGGPYYRTQREGSSWGPKIGMGGGITQFFHYYNATDGMAISPDEHTFIVAAGRNYDGNMDLYGSYKGRSGWSVCQRLPISTPGNERSVFIAGDGRTVYFASDGYTGFGGLDIYKAVINEDGSFGPVINVGQPFNTAADDYGLILTAHGDEAYFVRDGNIYFADLREADPRIKPGEVAIEHVLKGAVRDSNNWRGLSAKVMLLDARTKRLVRKVSTRANGSYEVDLPNLPRIYDLVVTADEYHSKRGRINVGQTNRSRTYTVNFLLSPQNPPTPPAPPAPPTPVVAEAPPTPEPAPKREWGPITALPTQPGPQLETKPLAAPKPKPLPIPESEYSFEGIAENNLTLLLDISGSMRLPGRLPLLKEALQRTLIHMRPEDRISLVAYAGNIQILLDGVSATNQEEVLAAIDGLASSGSTNGKGALRKAYNLAKQNFIASGNNRIIMTTDGAFNIEKLYKLAERIAEDRITLSVFSFEKLPGYRTEQLQELSRHGSGNHAVITPDNVDQALLREVKAVRKGAD